MHSSNKTTGLALEDMGWIYVNKLKEISEVYRGRDFQAAWDLTKEAMNMTDPPEYIRAQLLLISAVLGSKPALNAKEALLILQKIFVRSKEWSKERDNAFEKCMIVAEEYRTAVGGQDKNEESKFLAKQMKKRKESRQFMEDVRDIMMGGEQWERGYCIIDAHERVLKVVVAETEAGIKQSSANGKIKKDSLVSSE